MSQQKQHASTGPTTGQQPKKQQKKTAAAAGEEAASTNTAMVFKTRVERKEGGKGKVWVQVDAGMTRGAAIGLARAANKQGWYCWVVAAGGAKVVLRADTMPTFPLMIDGKRVEVKELTKEEGVAAASKAGNEVRRKKAKGGAMTDEQAREDIRKLREEMQAVKGQGGGENEKVKKQLATVHQLAKKARQEVSEVRQEVRSLEEKVSTAWATTSAAVEANTTTLKRLEGLIVHLINAQAPPLPQPQPQPQVQPQPQSQPLPQPQPKQQSQPQPQPAPATHQETPPHPNQQTINANLIAQVTGGPYQPPQEPQTPARDSRKQGRSSTAETPGGTTLNAAKKKPLCTEVEKEGIIAPLPNDTDDSDDAIYN